MSRRDDLIDLFTLDEAAFASAAGVVEVGDRCVALGKLTNKTGLIPNSVG